MTIRALIILYVKVLTRKVTIKVLTIHARTNLDH